MGLDIEDTTQNGHRLIKPIVGWDSEIKCQDKFGKILKDIEGTLIITNLWILLRRFCYSMILQYNQNICLENARYNEAENIDKLFFSVKENIGIISIENI